jgi:DNA-binding SARP family transcriptional activator/ABC-type branched-subunit amino acid transport system substrate-binding protein/DNA-binding beta-propeller fold protein YncE
LDFRILGPLEVRDGGAPLDVGAGKQRALLAILLLEAGAAVPVERLIDAIWEGDPPSSAVKSVHVYVSRLRKLLGARLLTRGQAYALQLQSGELDLHRFERLLAEGRERLAEGEAAAAARALEAGLELWRGPPLADFAYAGFAQGEIRRLEELRLAAVEERVDADLARGRDRELVPELEALAAEHPLRERLRGQVMLALYRSGRQAEALEAYRTGREAGVAELGLEPGRALVELQGAILRQDPQLEPPRRAHARVLPGRRRRGRLLAAIGGALLLPGAAAVGLALTGGEAPRGLTRVAPNSVAVIDPGTDRIVADVAVGDTPSSIAAGEGAVWVLNADDRTVSKLDPATLAVVRTVASERAPTDLATGLGALWVGSGAEAAASQVHGTFVPVGVARLDPGSGVLSARLGLPRPGSMPGALGRRLPGQHQIAVAGRSLWAVDAKGTVSRFDAGTNRLTGRTRGVAAGSLVADRGGVWATADDNTILRIDQRSGKVSQRVRLPTFTVGGIAAGAGAVWVTDPVAGTLWRIDPGPPAVTRTIAVGTGTNALAFGEGSVWAVNSIDGTVIRIDPDRDRVVARIAVGGAPREIAAGHGRIWVTVGVGGDTGRPQPGSGAPRAGAAGALPPSICGPVSYGAGGSPQLLIASKLPLRRGPRGSTLPMAQAIEFVLARHHFRAGRFTVGYQSCDDSTDQAGGEDPAKCVGNAQALAATRKVVGVVGPYGSGCAGETIPILNAAAGGPLALVSPSNSYPGLTRQAPGVPAGEVEGLYPAGARNFARVYPTDDYQSAALAMLAVRLDARRVFVLEDESGGGYTTLLSTAFQTAANALDLEIAGVATWDPGAASYGSLARRIARARPRAVFLSGIVFDNGPGLVRALRKALGREAVLLAPDGFSVVPFLQRQAGAAARGMYVSVNGAPNSALGPAGRRFVADFAATQPGGVVPSYTAAYAGQAAEVLLDAIARSDGTRGSVARALYGASVPDGILGPFGIDRNGDATVNPITILRVTDRRSPSPTLLADHAGTVLDRVLTPAAELVRGGG